jgi:hypothetical protein
VLVELFLSIVNHLELLREKIGNLRSEIAQLQELNDRYWLGGRNDTQAQVAHGQRHERLQEIQQELSQLADLGRRVRSVEQMKEHHRARPYLVNKAS